MPINTVIRSKRKELELTQEQIADYLGVSAPAVNKWEKGATYPDVTLLSPLARILKTDINTLLCFEESMTTNEILQFNTQIIEYIEQNGFESGFNLAIEKIKEYPNSTELIESTALHLDGALLMYGAELANKEYYEDFIFSLYERAAKGDDEKARVKALHMLVSKYMQKKDYEKAQQTLDLLPEQSEIDKKQLQAIIFREQNNLPEAAKLLEQKLLKAINDVQMTILGLIKVTLAEGNDVKAEKLSNCLKEIVKHFELWDYNAYVVPLQIAVNKKNVTNSIIILQSMLKCLMEPWSLQHSVLYNHLHKEENQSSKNIQREQSDFGLKMLPSILFDIENNPDYEFLHSNQEFVKLISEYRERCDHPAVKSKD